MVKTSRWGICLLAAALLLSLASPAGNGVQAQAAAEKTVKNHSSLEMKSGEKRKIRFKACKGKAEWRSSDQSVAAVKRKGKYGLIKAKKKGKATVTAKVGKKHFYCKIIVTDKKDGQPDDSRPADEENQNTDSGSGQGTGSGSNQGTDNGNSQGTGGGGNQGTDSGSTQAPQEDFDASAADSSDYSRYFSPYAIHHSTATYYDNGYTDTCCNFDDIASAYDVCAINEYDYNGGVMAGAYLEVTGPNGKVNVLVTDLMPYAGNEANCTTGALDLNENTFAKIANKIDGKVQISWKVIPFPTDGPLQYKFKPTSNQWWCEVQVRNHRYPIVKCEVKNNDGTYTELPRQEYNYFKAENGLGPGPYTFRVTDIYGHVLEDEVPLSPDRIVDGKANFPEE